MPTRLLTIALAGCTLLAACNQNPSPGPLTEYEQTFTGDIEDD